MSVSSTLSLTLAPSGRRETANFLLNVQEASAEKWGYSVVSGVLKRSQTQLITPRGGRRVSTCLQGNEHSVGEALG